MEFIATTAGYNQCMFKGLFECPDENKFIATLVDTFLGLHRLHQLPSRHDLGEYQCQPQHLFHAYSYPHAHLNLFQTLGSYYPPSNNLRYMKREDGHQLRINLTLSQADSHWVVFAIGSEGYCQEAYELHRLALKMLMDKVCYI